LLEYDPNYFVARWACIFTTTTTTKPLIPNKLGQARNETQSESIRSKISNISDNNKYDERKIK
jgi:hypothetical protein